MVWFVCWFEQVGRFVQCVWKNSIGRSLQRDVRRCYDRRWFANRHDASYGDDVMKSVVGIIAALSLLATSAPAGELPLCCFAGACVFWNAPPEDCPGEIVDPVPAGACCSGTSCAFPVSQDACDLAGGTYLGDNSQCSPIGGGCVDEDLEFPCCLEGSCSMQTADACLEMNGQIIAIPNIECSDVDCSGEPPVVGGCCSPLGCSDGLDEEFCTSTGGTYLGDGSFCSVELCPGTEDIFCCCIDGVCGESDPIACRNEDGVGTYQAGPVCSCNVGGAALCDEPFMIHGEPVTGDNEPPEETEPHTGYIDPRSESTTGDNVDLGVTVTEVVFSQPVFGDTLGGPLRTTNFIVTQTGGGEAPEVIEVERTSPKTVRLTLSKPLVPGEWTTIQSEVFSGFGTQILNQGNLGSENEPDRVDIASLPGDIDQNGIVQPLDLLRFRQGLNGTWTPEFGSLELYLDIDSNGEIQAVDLLRFRQLFQGSGNATQAWLGESLAEPRP